MSVSYSSVILSCSINILCLYLALFVLAAYNLCFIPVCGLDLAVNNICRIPKMAHLIISALFFFFAVVGLDWLDWCVTDAL